MEKEKKNLKKRQLFAFYLGNIVFGIEDSLVSTVGFLSGVSIAQVDRPTLLLSGIILIFIEAFSMGVGSFLSQDVALGYIQEKEADMKHPILGGMVMFVSYLVTGFIPLAPYLFISGSSAFLISIVISIITLFILGVWGAHLSKTNRFKQGIKMAIVGGIAIALGVIVGTFLQL